MRQRSLGVKHLLSMYIKYVYIVYIQQCIQYAYKIQTIGAFRFSGVENLLCCLVSTSRQGQWRFEVI